MKKFLSILTVVICLTFTAKIDAQSGSAATFPVVAGDSLATADSVYKPISVTAGYSQLAVQVSIKKGTGTLDGKLFLYTSVNANQYVLTDSAALTAVPTFGSVNANGGYTHTAIIQKTAPGGTKYIACITQAGSLTASPVLFSYTARKHD